ncbi:hypothetical protein [Subtercola endophyticus]|uniref:hypothetical protein n=1 Tax=Subtercola endophyticus TaxID=2895559 RepID=UPI001E3FDB34|nr:hypothetical protein [Subtercola endophyticus]UFS57494.1 hypothetical protein LQ955_10510 [Subtercola endophyticus]
MAEIDATQPLVRVEPATTAGWAQVEHALTGGGDGASCWCQWFLLPRRDFDAATTPELRDRLRAEVETQVEGEPEGQIEGDVEAELERQVERQVETRVDSEVESRSSAAPSPGLIAFVGDEAAGWVRVAPRLAQPRLLTSRVVKSGSPEPSDAADVWAISCLVVRREYRVEDLPPGWSPRPRNTPRTTARESSKGMRSTPISDPSRTASCLSGRCGCSRRTDSPRRHGPWARGS